MRGLVRLRLQIAAGLGVAAVVTGCVSYAHLYGPDGALDEAAAVGVGNGLYWQRCGLCHTPYEPAGYPMASWDGQIRKYGARAGLTLEQRKFVRLYLDSHAPDGERRRRLGSAPAAARANEATRAATGGKERLP